MNLEAQLNRNEKRRFAAEARAFDRLDRQLDDAKELIGELCREGKKVYYIITRNGKVKEGHYYTLTDFLIRNRYV